MHIFVKNQLLMGILQKNRAFFIFLAKFVLSYMVLSCLYWLYLNQYDIAKHETDSMTYLVAKQCRDVVNFIGSTATIIPDKSEGYRFMLNGKWVVRVVEGCNAISVMILFTAFIVAFSTTFKRTALYILIGLIIIHILNIVRIVLICYGVYYYREYVTLMHDIIFPLFIYGVVFVLWVAWVIKFSGNAKPVTTK